MANEAERKIMEMIEQGQITAEEGLRLMKAMNNGSKSTTSLETVPDETVVFPDAEEAPPSFYIPEEEQARMKKLKRWWILPFGVGLLITILGAVWMYTGFMARGFGVGFWLAWLPFLLGIFIIAVSFQTSKSVWLHVRIKQKPGETPQRIAISLPVPVFLTRWFLSSFGHRIPGLKDQPLDSYADMLDSLSPEEPFYVHVNDEDGEEVEVFIG